MRPVVPAASLVLIAGRAGGRAGGGRTREEQALTPEEQLRAKHEAELSVAPRLLKPVRLPGRRDDGMTG